MLVAEPTLTTAATGWKTYEKIAVRSILIFVIGATIPHDITYYREVIESFDKLEYKWRVIDNVSHHKGWFFENDANNNYVGYLLTLLGSFVLGTLWQVLDKKERNFDVFYYWVETIIRYVLVYRMSFYCITKIFPVQMPFPTIGQLNMNLGDFTPGKLYWLTTGAAPGFEVFAGVFEMIATVLLLFRRTVTIGALLMVSILVPVWVINIAYDAGVELTAFDYLFLSSVLLVKEAHRLWDFFILHQPSVLPYYLKSPLTKAWQQNLRIVLKVSFILFFIVYRLYEYQKIYEDGKSFKLPLTKGWAALTGFYNVPEFQWNQQNLPYSPTDPLRWQNVAFEKHNTVSIKIARPVALTTRNKDRTKEIFGNTGRVFYSYKVDSLRQTLVFKNRADSTEVLHFSYQQSTPSHLVLAGVTSQKDSIHVVLDRVERKYPLARAKGSFIPW